MLALALVVAPFAALLVAPTPRRCGVVAGAALGAGAGLVLCANLAVLADAAVALGAARWQALVPAAALILLVTSWPPAERWRAAVPVLALLALGLGVVGLGTGLGRTPWRAWADASSRPALVFGARSPWVAAGGTFARAATLTFDEPHRVTILTPGTYRVVEREAGGSTLREWPLVAGDALTLRAGDRLDVDPGARVRFEAGKRVPGAPPSGPEWSDPGARADPGALVGWLGSLVTLVGGALALVLRARTGWTGAAAAPALVTGWMLVAVAWGGLLLYRQYQRMA